MKQKNYLNLLFLHTPKEMIKTAYILDESFISKQTEQKMVEWTFDREIALWIDKMQWFGVCECVWWE